MSMLGKKSADDILKNIWVNVPGEESFIFHAYCLGDSFVKCQTLFSASKREKNSQSAELCLPYIP